MNEALDEVERAVALLNAKRAKVEQRITAVTVTRQQLAYAALVLGDREARARLAEVQAELGKLTNEASDLDVARTEADHRLAVAQRAAKRAADVEHRQRVEALLIELQPLGELLDQGSGTKRGTSAMTVADVAAWHYHANPQAQAKVAALIAATLVELKSLGIAADVQFPSHRLWDAASRQDLLRAVTDTVFSGWRNRAQGLPARHS
jgi:hypothetical protein